MKSFARPGLVKLRTQPRVLQDISSDEDKEVLEEIRPVLPRHHYILKPIRTAVKRPPKEVFQVVVLDEEIRVPTVLQPVPQQPASNTEQFVQVVNVESPEIQRYFQNKADLIRMTTINKKIIEKQMCAICLGEPGSDKGSLQCGHIFCLGCITESSKFSTKCPYCRQQYVYINSLGRKIPVESRERHEDETFEDQPCYVCGRDDHHDRLLVCDICEFACCHIDCDRRLNGRLPPGNWYCNSCTVSMQQQQQRQRNSTRLMRNLMTIYRNTQH